MGRLDIKDQEDDVFQDYQRQYSRRSHQVQHQFHLVFKHHLQQPQKVFRPFQQFSQNLKKTVRGSIHTRSPNLIRSVKAPPFLSRKH